MLSRTKMSAIEIMWLREYVHNQESSSDSNDDNVSGKRKHELRSMELEIKQKTEKVKTKSFS